jgi:eukaryotic-like serine/threonine-protein kinase
MLTVKSEARTTSSFFIGKFQVIGQLGRGGMADVYLCRLQGIGGFDKEVVLKRILPERAGDPHFVRMFLDEARLVANLNHPNIVQVFEIGEQDGVPFMAMEYIKGVTLSMIIRAARRQRKIHYGHSANIVAGICDALEYAHHSSGPDGLPLGLVHRDVTPGNIVVSTTGTPKLLDFGVALSRGRMTQTEAGTIKGKLRYLAPEQISQGPLDHRADVFSLGVCLFQLTTGHHPFGPPNASEVATLKNILNGVISRPTALVPSYPPALEAIVLSTLEMDVNKRCPSAAELRRRLAAFVAENSLRSDSRELTAWLRELFPDFGKLTQTGSLSAFSGSNWSGPVPLATPVEGPAAAPAPPPAPSRPQAESIPRKIARHWKRALVASVALVIAAAAGSALRSEPRPENVAVVVSQDDAAAAYLDAAEKLAAEKRFVPALELVAKAKGLKIVRPDLNIRLARVNDVLTNAVLLRDATRAAADAPEPAADPAPENAEPLAPVARFPRKASDGFISISTTPPGLVYLNGEVIGRSPMARRRIPFGRHMVLIRAPGYRSSETEVKLAPRQTVALGMVLAVESEN